MIKDLTYKEGKVPTVLVLQDDEAETVWSFSMPQLAPGTYYVRIKASDCAGNEKFSSIKPFVVTP